MKHFLITRFNLKVEDWKTTRDGSNVLTTKWLEDRMGLFKKFCYPSVINQLNKNFVWLIFLDEDSPEWIRKEMKALESSFKNLKLFYVDGIESFFKELKNIIVSFLDNECKQIVTTRLDNDDAIHENFINKIQELIPVQNKTIIDLRKGYQLDIRKNKNHIRTYSTIFNPFLSLVEDRENFVTVYSKQHTDWKDENFIEYNDTPLWIEIVHDRNKLNDVKNGFPLTRAIDSEEFGIKENFKKISLIEVVLLNIYNKICSSTKIKILREKIKFN